MGLSWEEKLEVGLNLGWKRYQEGDNTVATVAALSLQCGYDDLVRLVKSFHLYWLLTMQGYEDELHPSEEEARNAQWDRRDMDDKRPSSEQILTNYASVDRLLGQGSVFVYDERGVDVSRFRVGRRVLPRWRRTLRVCGGIRRLSPWQAAWYILAQRQPRDATE